MESSLQKNSVLPFLKWAGGKRWLMEYPETLDIFPKEFETYIEPFLGSGAVFFKLFPKRSILSDSNADLIETYKAIRNDWRSVWKRLRVHHELHSDEYYYKVRSSNPYSSGGRAAKFIYLNRTCYNGLYRVNLKGEFNVPVGTKRNVVLESDDFNLVSELLGQAKLIVSDFEPIVDSAKRNDFVFIDPPYTVKHNLNGFVKYNEKLFSWEDQVRLRDSVVRAKSRGVKVLVLNADHESIRELYQGESMQSLSRKSVISANSLFRGKYSELAIRCW